MLNVINLDFDYQDQLLLNNVSFHLPAGGLLHLRGANGAGKTTLLKVIAGLYPPQQGEIQFLGQNIEQDRFAYQQQLCFVGHKTGINPNLTLRENCYFDLHARSVVAQKMDEIEKLVTIFKLEHYLDVPCSLLSAGQRRQVGLLRLWMSDARLWLLDEPLVALDERAITAIMAKIETHRQHGGAVLLTSHQHLALKRTDYREYCL